MLTETVTPKLVATLKSMSLVYVGRKPWDNPPMHFLGHTQVAVDLLFQIYTILHAQEVVSTNFFPLCVFYITVGF